MAIRPIITDGAHKILRGKAKRVGRIDDSIRRLIDDMIDTMREAPGVGLAAPQIGVPLRVIVLEDREELLSYLSEAERQERERAPFPVRAIINPVLRPIEGDRVTFFEGCLSVKGYVGLVERAREVEVTGVDVEGAPITWRVKGWPARILQHEVDLLLREGTQTFLRTTRREHAMALQCQQHFERRPHGVVVVDDQDACHRRIIPSVWRLPVEWPPRAAPA